MYRMLDLHPQAVAGWLQAIQPARTDADWPPPIRPIEASDDAAGLFEKLSEALGKHHDDGGARLAVALADPKMVASLRTVLAQLGAARMLRIVAALADVLPDGTMAPVQSDLRDRKTAEGRALGAALDATAQTTLRGRLTAQHRLEALARAVEQQPAPEKQ